MSVPTDVLAKDVADFVDRNRGVDTGVDRDDHVDRSAQVAGGQGARQPGKQCAWCWKAAPVRVVLQVADKGAVLSGAGRVESAGRERLPGLQDGA